MDKKSKNEKLYDAAVKEIRTLLFDDSIDDDLARDVFDGLMDDIEDLRRERFGESRRWLSKEPEGGRK